MGSHQEMTKGGVVAKLNTMAIRVYSLQYIYNILFIKLISSAVQ